MSKMTRRDAGITYNVIMLLLLLYCFLCCFQYCFLHCSNTVTISLCLSFTPVSRTALLTSSHCGRCRQTEAGAGGERRSRSRSRQGVGGAGGRATAWRRQVVRAGGHRGVVGGTSWEEFTQEIHIVLPIILWYYILKSTKRPS